MGELLMMIVALCALAAPVVASIALWRWGRRVAERRGTRAWRLASALPLVGAAVLGLGTCVSSALLIPAFAAVTGADSADKATTLAKAISEAMNCGAFFGLGAVLLLVVSAGLFAWASFGRPPSDDSSGRAGARAMSERFTNCGLHGRQGIALACVHVARAIDSGERVGFYWSSDTDLGRPDAWCASCEAKLVALEGADATSWFREADFKILCVECWDEAKQRLYAGP
ncbi:MAG: hypothetical protein H5U40_18190 [Polyangiaceae bacterium]|nr:hypothetical protein [Polyangiaceae bacterium]